MAIINTRSPFFVSITDSSISYATLDIEIYTGDKTSDFTGTPDYELKKSKIGSNTTITFEIAELIRDFLEIVFNGSYSSTNEFYVSKWVRTVITSYDATDTQLSQTIDINLALNGFNYFEEGSTSPTVSTFISNKVVFALADNTYSVPFYTGNGGQVSFIKDGEVLNTFNLTASDESEEQIVQVSVNDLDNYQNYEERVLTNANAVVEKSSCLTRFFDDVSVGDIDTISITGEPDIKVITISECKYQPYKITFINKFGVLQDMFFFKKAVEAMTTKRETYKGTTINNGVYSISDHTKRDFNIQANETIKLSSGYLNEEYNEVFKQMMLSEKIWLTDEDDNVLPINIKTSSINYKTSLNDKLVEYTIDFDRSYNVINNVR